MILSSLSCQAKVTKRNKTTKQNVDYIFFTNYSNREETVILHDNDGSKDLKKQFKMKISKKRLRFEDILASF